MKSSILIVDDTPQNIQILATILSEQQYEIEYALSGKEGLNLLYAEKIDLILLDIMMPEMDGFEVCKTIRQQPKFDDVPIIFLTAKTDKESVYEGFELGAQDFVSKPFDYRELLARIKTQIELRESRQKLKDLNFWLEEEVEKRTVEIVEANNKLEAANAELIGLDNLKSDFLSIISHEIRTPLNGINGAMQLLKHHVDSIKLSKYIELLDTSISRLEKFSLIALRITSLKTGKYVISKDSINLSELIEIAAVNLSDIAAEKNVKLDLSELTDSVNLLGEYDLMSFCIESLMENAVRYTNPGTTVSLRSKVTPDTIEISILDQGNGYSENELNNIFKFFNTVNSLDNSPGLGLPFSRLIIEAHGGSVEVFNNQDIGSTIKAVFVLNPFFE